MSDLNLSLKTNLLQSTNTELVINGVDKSQWAILFQEMFGSNPTGDFARNLFILPTEKEAEEYFSSIQELDNTFFYPNLGCEIYSSMIPSEFNLIKRISLLNNISQLSNCNIVCSLESALLFVPPEDFFSKGNFKISISDVISPQDLAKELVNLGYNNTPSCEEPGTFSTRGEIFDLYPLNSDPVRLIYFDDMIEEIHPIDLKTMRSDKSTSIETIEISKTQYNLLNKDFINEFRSQFPRPNFTDKDKFSYRETIFKKLNSGSFFEDYPLFISMFFSTKSTLLDYTKSFNIFFFNQDSLEYEYNNLAESLKLDFENFSNESDFIKPSPEQIFNLNFEWPKNKFAINQVDVQVDLNDEIKNIISLNIIPTINSKFTKKFEILDFLKRHTKSNSTFRVYYTKDAFRAEMEYLLTNTFKEKLPQISYHKNYLKEGFVYPNEDLFFLSETDFFNQKTKKVSKKNLNIDHDIFAEQISTLQVNDHVIHKDFGVGIYQGIETLELSGNKSDYLVLKFLDDDKVYVPVYKINLIQKHSSSESKVTLSNLKTKKFENAKAKAKTSVKKLAFDLLELQAKRKMKRGYSFSEIDHDYTDFALSFKFTETPDQASAINNVLEDMISERPMDRLVCGDVGFGKTEVAIRAAFKAVQDNKQVCVLVPTTVLALQHFNSFVERFKQTAVNIDYISRFKTTKQVNETLLKLAEGKVDILIGTHKILSDKVSFKDLGLLIIDEEQRFGVGHKEKLKLLRENIDTLTLTATPIPRTLQMSFLGIKDLSTIKTPPPKRQSIKTYVIKEDANTIRMAINKELSRGGQVFIIHNKVSDIEIFTSKIRELVPEARIIFAHGQLPERELEKRISEFYNYKYDILIATTIIESGIDIPRANTMIIDRADTYGLSQLHQLRGRIGRSDKKAYAYFMVPKHQKLSEIAAKRLRALQTYADLGSGYSLATSDLEIRGSGDILGPEQSGHIGNIGLELYMELLKECINELKGESRVNHYNIEIQTPFSSYIPNTYINNSGMRLKYYKKVSNSENIEELDDIKEELIDQFGKLTDEVSNLFLVIESRINLKRLAIEHIKVGSRSITLKFNKNEIEQDDNLRNKVINLFTQRPKIYKINPDYSINCKFKDTVLLEDLLDFSKHLNKNLN